MKNPTTYTFTEEDMSKITFDLNTAASRVKRIGDYIDDHKGVVDIEHLKSWAKHLEQDAKKILAISENLTK